MFVFRVFSVLSLIFAISACGSHPQASSTKSLTDSTYHGKKIYFGWGKNGNGDESMDNEAKYDVLHTHDIFTKAVGGDYEGTTLIGENQVSGRAIKQKWKSITKQLTANDMYLQYSSGHGYEGGLEAGVTYDDIIDATLAMPAKETIIFTMACHSGGLVDAFNDAKSRWSSYKSQGRTLFVMASSLVSEDSSTGPGTDPHEPNGPDGSAGSAFGHSLWMALIGYADQVKNGGNGDGIMTLDEIIKYVVKDTKETGGHTPVYTGVYDPKLPIAKTPSFAQAAQILGDTEEGQVRLKKLVEDDVLAPDAE